MAERVCAGKNEKGKACRQAPLRDGDYCFWHSPDHTEEAAEARKLGGLRRRKERTVAAAYDLEGLNAVSGLRRLLEIASLDLVTLDNTVPRNRALISAVAGGKLLETGELEERLSALEATVAPRKPVKGRGR